MEFILNLFQQSVKQIVFSDGEQSSMKLLPL